MSCEAWDLACAIEVTKPVWESLQSLSWVPDPLRPKVLWIWETLAANLDVKTVGGLAFGAGGFYVSWLRRDAKIFERLERLLEKEEPRLRHARDDVIAAMLRPAPSSVSEHPIFAIADLNRVLKKRNWESALSAAGKAPKAEKQLCNALREIERQESLQRHNVANYLRQKNAAYLLQGAISSARAERTKNENARAQLRGQAVGHFNNALSVKTFENDAVARELLGHQLLISGEYEVARDTFAAIVDVPPMDEHSVPISMRLVRAQYGRALAQVRLGQKTNAGNNGLRNARGWLADATENHLPNGALLGRDLLDKAQAYELLAEVRLKLGESILGPQDLSKADAAYQTLANQNQKTRLTSALARISRRRTRVAELERRRLLLAAIEGHKRCDTQQRGTTATPPPVAAV